MRYNDYNILTGVMETLNEQYELDEDEAEPTYEQLRAEVIKDLMMQTARSTSDLNDLLKWIEYMWPKGERE
jgi:hypothetical protein